MVFWVSFFSRNFGFFIWHCGEKGKEALDRMNDRICRELGMYYDSDYHLVLKK